jgi:hypothetical protein
VTPRNLPAVIDQINPSPPTRYWYRLANCSG